MAPFVHNFLDNKRYIYELKKIQNQFDQDAINDSPNSKTKITKDFSTLRPMRKIYDLMSSATTNQLNELIHEISNSYKKKNTSRITKNYAIF